MIRAQSPVNTALLDAAIAATAASAADAAASVVEMEALAADFVENGAISQLSFQLLNTAGPIPGLTSVSGAFEGQSATVWDDTDANNGVYSWQSAAWVRIHDNPSQEIAVLSAAFLPSVPMGDALEPGSYVVIQPDGWIVVTYQPSAMRAVTNNLDWLLTAPLGLKFFPTGGDIVIQQPDGWIVQNLSRPASSSGAAFVPTQTDGQVASVLGDEIGSHPLIAGKTVFCGLGESTANGLDFMSNTVSALCTQYGTPLPGGATVDDLNQFHDGYAIDDTIAAWSVTTAAIDTVFAAGAECLGGILLNEQGNDMVALTDVDYWESRVLQFIRMVQGYADQKYLGTNPLALAPTLPCFMTMFNTWANGDLKTDIPLRAVEMSRRIIGFGISTAEYIADFSDNRHYLNGIEARRISAWGGIALYEWLFNGRKFHPTQVDDAWFDGTSAYLKIKMPKPPLQVSHLRVTAIANNGLEAFTARGAPYTITGVSILPNGQVLKVDKATPWVAGDQIWGAITPTTPGTAGHVTGNRSDLCDSSTYTINLGGGAGPELFQSHLLPFKKPLIKGTT